MREKSFLEKIGILVPEEDNSTGMGVGFPNSKSGMSTEKVPDLKVGVGNEANNNVSGDVISDAYATLPKSENDIYIVEELIKNFAMLPDETKPQVVRNTLETMGKDVAKFIMEATTKKNALLNGIGRYAENIANEVAKLDSEIASAEEVISKCKQKQLDYKNNLEKQKQFVTTETQRLEKIIEILGGK